jgi:hypothetical protein
MAMRRCLFLSALAALTAVLTATVLATPPSGQLSSATLARGMFADPWTSSSKSWLAMKT